MRAAVIGAGHIAKQHLAALKRQRGVEVAGVCDLSPATAEAVAEQFAIGAWYTDYRQMLAATRPDVVHITTPAPTHCRLATDCLRHGANVLVEKPITTDTKQLETLLAEAAEADRWVVEDYNYQFNTDIQKIRRLLGDGRLGEVRRVEICLHLNIYAEGSRFTDRDNPHPAMGEPLGAVSDFLTHMAYLAYLFVGRAKIAGVSVRRGEVGDGSPESLLATLDGRTGQAVLAFDAYARPEEFTVRVYGARLSAQTNLFERGVVMTRSEPGAGPLSPIRGALLRGSQEGGAAVRSLSRKLSGGPGPYEGLWRLIGETYAGLEQGKAPPIGHTQIREVNRLVHDLTTAGSN